MNRQSADEQERSLGPETLEHKRDDNEAWALKWDGAALAAMRENKEEQERCDRP